MSLLMLTPPTKHPTEMPLWNCVRVSASLAIWKASSRVGERTSARTAVGDGWSPRRRRFSMVGMRNARVCAECGAVGTGIVCDDERCALLRAEAGRRRGARTARRGLCRGRRAFPVPVLALARQSLPFRMTGRVRRCTSVIVS